MPNFITFENPKTYLIHTKSIETNFEFKSSIYFITRGLLFYLISLCMYIHYIYVELGRERVVQNPKVVESVL
jgi:hypothetical protein